MKQLKDKHAPYLQAFYYFAHRTNLAFKPLNKLKPMDNTVKVLNSTYHYFHKSPRRFQEFVDLALEMKERGLKMLKNSKTRWVSLLDPLRRLISQYRSVFTKMHQSRGSEAPAQASLMSVFSDFL